MKKAHIVSRDYDGLILDMLDDIVVVEQRVKRLVDRLDTISKNPSLRVISIDNYYWLVGGIAVAASVMGIVIGVALCKLLVR